MSGRPQLTWDEEHGRVSARFARRKQKVSELVELQAWAVYDRDGVCIGFDIDECRDFLKRFYSDVSDSDNDLFPPHPPTQTTEYKQLDPAGSEGEGEGGTSREPPQPPQCATVKKKQDQDSGTRRATRIPVGWTYSENLKEWAAEQVPDVDLEWEDAKFRDYWNAKSGKDATKADWDATWRNWMRTAAGRAPRGRPPRTESTSDRKARENQELKEQLKREGWK